MPQAAASLGLAGRARPAYRSAIWNHEGVAIDLDETTEFLVAGKTRIDEVYLLERRHPGSAPVVSAPLSVAEAAAHLAAAGYWMPHLPQDARAIVLHAALRLARSVPVRHVGLPDCLGALPAVVSTLCGMRPEGA
jgi:hypothetical protein